MESCARGRSILVAAKYAVCQMHTQGGSCWEESSFRLFIGRHSFLSAPIGSASCDYLCDAAIGVLERVETPPSSPCAPPDVFDSVRCTRSVHPKSPSLPLCLTYRRTASASDESSQSNLCTTALLCPLGVDLCGIDSEKHVFCSICVLFCVESIDHLEEYHQVRGRKVPVYIF